MRFNFRTLGDTMNSVAINAAAGVHLAVHLVKKLIASGSLSRGFFQTLPKFFRGKHEHNYHARELRNMGRNLSPLARHYNKHM